MSPAILFAVIGHIGTLIKAGKDVETIVSDIVTKKAVGPDAMALLDDLAAVLIVFPIPGVDPALVTKFFADIKSAV